MGRAVKPLGYRAPQLFFQGNECSYYYTERRVFPKWERYSLNSLCSVGAIALLSVWRKERRSANMFLANPKGTDNINNIFTTIWGGTQNKWYLQASNKTKLLAYILIPLLNFLRIADLNKKSTQTFWTISRELRRQSPSRTVVMVFYPWWFMRYDIFDRHLSIWADHLSAPKDTEWSKEI